MFFVKSIDDFTMVIDGAIVSGVMKRKIKPTSPAYIKLVSGILDLYSCVLTQFSKVTQFVKFNTKHSNCDFKE